MCVCAKILLLLAFVDAAISLNVSLTEPDRNLLANETRRSARNGKDRSTSSSSGERGSSGTKESADDSLEVSAEKASLTEDSDSKQSAEKVIGWRKYHRVCPPCPGDMAKKPTDKSIQWVCGGYQRARRTFKSLCMMRMRNCQDGTMFVKLYDGFCRAPDDGSPLGDHFFYDYKNDDSDDSIDSSNQDF